MLENTNHNNEESALEPSSNIINVGWPERLVSASLGTLFLSSGITGLFHNPGKSLFKTIVGGFLLYRGASGNCPAYSAMGKQPDHVVHAGSLNVRTSIVVNRPKVEVYAFWRNLENLPAFMKHIKNITQYDETRSHWEANVPGNVTTLKWDAEIIEEEMNNKIAWRSVDNASIQNAGKVVFEDALGGRGTKLNILISYRPPAGDVGLKIAKLFNSRFEKMIHDDLANFKTHIEQLALDTPDISSIEQTRTQVTFS